VEKKKNFHHYNFGYDLVAKNSLSLSSLVLSKPLKWAYLKKSDLRDIAIYRERFLDSKALEISTILFPLFQPLPVDR
jgi:hypothetical protein